MAVSQLTLRSDCLELCFSIAFKTIWTQKYYKNNSCFQTRALNEIWRIYRLYNYITPTLSCEPRFGMFIINGYYTKFKHLQSLNSLFKRCNNILLCDILLDRKYCR